MRTSPAEAEKDGQTDAEGDPDQGTITRVKAPRDRKLKATREIPRTKTSPQRVVVGRADVPDVLKKQANKSRKAVALIRSDSGVDLKMSVVIGPMVIGFSVVVRVPLTEIESYRKSELPEKSTAIAGITNRNPLEPDPGDVDRESPQMANNLQQIGDVAPSRAHPRLPADHRVRSHR